MLQKLRSLARYILLRQDYFVFRSLKIWVLLMIYKNDTHNRIAASFSLVDLLIFFFFGGGSCFFGFGGCIHRGLIMVCC